MATSQLVHLTQMRVLPLAVSRIHGCGIIDSPRVVTVDTEPRGIASLQVWSYSSFAGWEAVFCAPPKAVTPIHKYAWPSRGAYRPYWRHAADRCRSGC